MKKLILIVLLSSSSNIFAMSTVKLIKACEIVGIQKVVSQAEAMNLEVNIKNINECGVDNRRFTPSSYVWFCATTTGGEKEIRVLTQKPKIGKCF